MDTNKTEKDVAIPSTAVEPQTTNVLDTEMSQQVISLIEEHSMRMHSGPLPSADEFAKYEQTLKGVADRIMSLTEKEQAHRHNMEKETMSLHHKGLAIKGWQIFRGQFFALAIACIVLFVAYQFMVKGYSTSAATIICTTLVGIVTSFLYGSKQNKEKKPIEKDTQDDNDTNL